MGEATNAPKLTSQTENEDALAWNNKIKKLYSTIAVVLHITKRSTATRDGGEILIVR